jgi:hypothetical protein
MANTYTDAQPTIEMSASNPGSEFSRQAQIFIGADRSSAEFK